MTTGNLLVQRVKRHAQTTALFRQVDKHARPFPQTADTPISQAVVHAGLETLPRGEVLDLPPVTAVPITPMYDSRETAVPTPTTHSAAPTPTVQAKPAEPDSGDPGWRRLSTIMRKHQEKPAIEKTAEHNETPPTLSRYNSGEEEEEMAMDRPDSAGAGTGVSKAPPGTIDGNAAIGGSVQTGGNLTVGGSASIAGPASVGGSASVGGAATIGANANIGANAAVGGSVATGGKTAIGSSATIGGAVSAGTSLETEGDANIGGPATVGNKVNVGGDAAVGATLSAGSKISAGGDVATGSSLTAGANVTSGGDIKAGGPAEIGGGASSVGDIAAGTSMTVGSAAVAAGDISAGAAMTSGAAIGAMGDVNVAGPASAGAALGAQGDVNVGGSATVGVASAGGDLSVGGSVMIGGSANVGGTINAGGNVTIGGSTNAPVSGATGGGAIQRQMDDSPPTPLEAAWPVQRKSDAATPAVPTLDTRPILPRLAPENEQVAAALQDVTAERSSRSSVELVPPRRPRPTNAPTLIQRTPEKAAAKSNETAVPNSDTVPTAIGPLPADLWQLLGQEPPAPTVMRSSVGGQSRTEQVEETRSTVADRPDVPAPPKPQDMEMSAPASAEQREGTAEETAVTEQSSAPTSESENTASSAAGETTEPDIDELARRVYGNLKRRLSIEWERMRGKN